MHNYCSPGPLHHHTEAINSSNSDPSQRSRDYASRPAVTKPSPYFHSSRGVEDNKRDAFLTQKHNSSRQTMSTTCETATNSSYLGHGNSSYRYDSVNQVADGEWRRRAEENAAFVRMLEEEAFRLQGGTMAACRPKETAMVPEVIPVGRGSCLPPTLPHDMPSRRSSLMPATTRTGRTRPSLFVTNFPKSPLVVPEGKLNKPALFVPKSPPFVQESKPTEYPMDFRQNTPPATAARSFNEYPRQHSAQLELLQLQRRHGSASPSSRSNSNSNSNQSENNDERALVDQMEQMLLAQQRRLPSNYDEVLNDGGNHNHNRPSPRASPIHNYDGQSPSASPQHYSNTKGGDYHHEIVLHHRADVSPIPPQHEHHRDHDQHQHQQYHPPAQPQALDEEHYDTVNKLLPPVDCIEFPTDWQGMEIEETEDDDLMDREKDYRRLQQQQQQRRPRPIRKSFSNVTRETYADADSIRPAGTKPMTIEVSPGVTMRFWGSEETWKAFATNRICQAKCLGCCIPLYCVEDAELVVCPGCQTISPVYATIDGNLEANKKRSGLGLGVKEEQLMQWHTEL